MSVTTNGYCDQNFRTVEDLLRASLSSGEDLGASVSVTVNGEVVVDLWGGWADEAQTRPWQSDTIVNVYSTTKTMAALVMLMLADRGDVDIDAPIARYWPEFATAGKEQITSRQVLSHTSGLSGWRETVAMTDLYDWDKATGLLAAQAPFWKPGTRVGYHAMTQGFLLGEVVRRATGTTMGSFLRDEVCGPLQADFHIGFGPQLDDRVADLVPPPPRTIDLTGADPILANVATNPARDVRDTTSRQWRAAEMPAVNGHGNARSIAVIQSILANGGVADGKTFLTERTCRMAAQLVCEGHDPIVGKYLRFGTGFALSGELIDMPHESSMFWGGGGGSLVVIDLDARMTMAFAMNKMSHLAIGDPRSTSLAYAVWGALESQR